MTYEQIENLSAKKTIFWLTKTLKTVSNSGLHSFENYRVSELSMRYESLIARAKELGVWTSFCESHGFSVDHDHIDIFA